MYMYRKFVGESERESAIGVQSVNKSPNLAGQYLDKSSRSILTLHFSIEFPKHVLHALLNVVSLIFSIKSLNGWFWFESWWHMYLITGVRALVFIWPQEGFCLNLFIFSPEYINWLWESLLGGRICWSALAGEQYCTYFLCVNLIATAEFGEYWVYLWNICYHCCTGKSGTNTNGMWPSFLTCTIVCYVLILELDISTMMLI